MEKRDLMRGKVTVKWKNYSYYIYSGDYRPFIDGFETKEAASQYLIENHGIKL